MKKNFTPMTQNVISVERLDELQKIFGYCEVNRNDWYSNQCAADWCYSGLLPNPSLAKEFEQKLALPEQEIPDHLNEVYKHADSLKTVFISEFTIDQIFQNLFMIHEYNSHEAIRHVVAVFKNGLPGNKYNARHFEKRVDGVESRYK